MMLTRQEIEARLEVKAVLKRVDMTVGELEALETAQQLAEWLDKLRLDEASVDEISEVIAWLEK